MTGITRRQISAAGLGLIASRLRGAYNFTHPLGAELYTVRNVLPTAADETLKSIAAIGYREVEPDRATLLRIAPMLKQYGLKPVACHIETPLITGVWKPWVARPTQQKTPYLSEGTTLQQAMDEVKKLGVEYIVMAYLLPQERGDSDYYKDLADKMNRAGLQARAAGLRFCYHNHAFEFRGEHGQRPIDILLERLDRKAVGIELDVFWVSVGGNDPAALLKRLAGRVPLVHLKDKAKGAPVVYEEAKVTPQTFKEVGAGSLDFAAILKAAAAAGAKHYFVEQDQTPGDPVASLKQSYDYLRNL
jgi:sugar phosphate isomerase/epimerase